MKKISAMGILAVTGLAATASARPAYVGAGFAIPDNAPAGASSSIVVSDNYTISAMTVTMDWGSALGPATGHSWVGDLIATLSFSPSGGGGPIGIDLFRRVGATTTTGLGSTSDMRGVYSFDDAAPAAPTFWTAAVANPVTAGTYKASSNSLGYLQVNMLSSYGGQNVNGTWTLKIVDAAGGDTGGIVSWTLTASPTPGAASLLGLAGVGMLRRRR